jgi:cytoskeletal protein CcmA (bactofilin family)
MWKKEEAQKGSPAGPESMPVREPRPAPSGGRERATIGRSITIRGEVTGDEDLLIQGRIEGSIDLKQHSVTVGSEGDVKADISGRVVTIEGSVEGDLRAEEQIVLKGSARVNGDMAAPRVILEDGAYFRGGVDMTETSGRPGTREAAKRPAPETGVGTRPSATSTSAGVAASEGGTSAAGSSG